MKEMLKFVAMACAAVGLMVSAGCKSDCEKAYANMEGWAKSDDPEAKEVAEDLKKKDKAAHISECEKKSKETGGADMLKCMVDNSDFKAAKDCLGKLHDKK